MKELCRGQELVKVSDMVIFHLYHLSAFSCTGKWLSLFPQVMWKHTVSTYNVQKFKKQQRKERLIFRPGTYFSKEPRPNCFYWGPWRAGWWGRACCSEPMVCFVLFCF